jgi:predicted DNA-binding protein|tara:strand:+ start:329 stop:547 length:219 start_codon:yes stop_codon:yes gene_type:complete
MLSIELPEDVSNRLELLSLSTGRTMQFYVKEALLEYLEEVEITYEEKEQGNEEHWCIFDDLNSEYGNENGFS